MSSNGKNLLIVDEGQSSAKKVKFAMCSSREKVETSVSNDYAPLTPLEPQVYAHTAQNWYN